MTTAPRPLTAKTRSMASVGGRAGTAGAPRRKLVERGADGVEPLAASRRTRRGPGSRQGTSARGGRPRPRRPPSTRSGSTASILVTTAMPGRDAERVEQREVLERLGARAVVGGHDQHRGIDLAGADEHVADQLVVPGHVDEVDRRPVVERRGGRSRHRSSSRAGAPRAAGRRRCRSARAAASSCRDRCGRPCRRRRSCAPAASARSTAAARSSSWSGSTVRRSSTTRPSSMRPMTGGSPRAQRGERAGRRSAARPPARPTGGSRRAATRRRRSSAGPRASTPSPSRGRSASARARSASSGVAIIRQTGMSVVARPARYRPSVSATPGHRDLVRSHRPGQRVAPHPGDEVRATDDEAGLRPADELVAAERHDVRAGGQALRRHRLVGQPVRRPCRAARPSRGRR